MAMPSAALWRHMDTLDVIMMEEPSTQNLTQTTLHGGAWLSFAAIMQVGLQFATVGILARLLTPTDFGIVAAAMVVVDLSQGLALLGMKPAVVQRPSLTEDDLRAAYTIAVGLSSLLTISVFLLAGIISELLRTPAAEPMLQLLSLVFVIQAQSAVAEGLAARRRKFKLLAMRRIASYLIGYVAIGITCALLGYGAWSLIAAKLGEVTSAAVLLSIGSNHSRRPLFDRDRLKQLTGFGAGFSVARIANTLANQADYVVVARVLGPASLGLYSRSYQIMRLPAQLIGNVIEDVGSPGFAAVQNERARLARGLYRSLLLMNMLLFLVAVTCTILAPEIIAIALGPKWHQAAPLLSLFAFAIPFRSSQRLATTVSRSTGANWNIAVGQTLYFISVLVGAYLGSHWGLIGVVLGVSVAILLQCCVQFELVSRLTGLPLSRIFMTHLLPMPAMLLLGLPMWGAALAMRTWTGNPFIILIASLVAGGAALLIGNLVLPRVFLPEEGRDMLDALLGKVRSMLRREAHKDSTGSAA